jgi:hypothetical protein
MVMLVVGCSSKVEMSNPIHIKYLLNILVEDCILLLLLLLIFNLDWAESIFPIALVQAVFTNWRLVNSRREYQQKCRLLVCYTILFLTKYINR